MLCPHCARDTPASQTYCQHCGGPVDLTYDKVQQSFEEEAGTAALRATAARCRAVLLGAAAALAIAVAARVALVPRAPETVVVPAYLVGEEDAEGPVVEPLPLEVPAIAIPR
jgi:hypothetical protein